MKSSPCLNCQDKKVTEDYNCHSKGNCKLYDDFIGYRNMISENRKEYQKGRVYESQTKLKKVKRASK